jgi:hypothetical protein
MSSYIENINVRELTILPPTYCLCGGREETVATCYLASAGETVKTVTL